MKQGVKNGSLRFLAVLLGLFFLCGIFAPLTEISAEEPVEYDVYFFVRKEFGYEPFLLDGEQFSLKLEGLAGTYALGLEEEDFEGDDHTLAVKHEALKSGVQRIAEQIAFPHVSQNNRTKWEMFYELENLDSHGGNKSNTGSRMLLGKGKNTSVSLYFKRVPYSLTFKNIKKDWSEPNAWYPEIQQKNKIYNKENPLTFVVPFGTSLDRDLDEEVGTWPTKEHINNLPSNSQESYELYSSNDTDGSDFVPFSAADRPKVLDDSMILRDDVKYADDENKIQIGIKAGVNEVEPETIEYDVKFWVQSLDGSGHEEFHSITKSGKVGEYAFGFTDEDFDDEGNLKYQNIVLSEELIKTIPFPDVSEENRPLWKLFYRLAIVDTRPNADMNNKESLKLKEGEKVAVNFYFDRLNYRLTFKNLRQDWEKDNAWFPEFEGVEVGEALSFDLLFGSDLSEYWPTLDKIKNIEALGEKKIKQYELYMRPQEKNVEKTHVNYAIDAIPQKLDDSLIYHYTNTYADTLTAEYDNDPVYELTFGIGAQFERMFDVAFAWMDDRSPTGTTYYKLEDIHSISDKVKEFWNDAPNNFKLSYKNENNETVTLPLQFGVVKGNTGQIGLKNLDLAIGTPVTLTFKDTKEVSFVYAGLDVDENSTHFDFTYTPGEDGSDSYTLKFAWGLRPGSEVAGGTGEQIPMIVYFRKGVEDKRLSLLPGLIDANDTKHETFYSLAELKHASPKLYEFWKVANENFKLQINGQPVTAPQSLPLQFLYPNEQTMDAVLGNEQIVCNLDDKVELTFREPKDLKLFQVKSDFANLNVSRDANDSKLVTLSFIWNFEPTVIQTRSYSDLTDFLQGVLFFKEEKQTTPSEEKPTPSTEQESDKDESESKSKYRPWAGVYRAPSREMVQRVDAVKTPQQMARTVTSIPATGESSHLQQIGLVFLMLASVIAIVKKKFG